MADGVMDHFYNEDKNETYEIADAQARTDIDTIYAELDTKVDKVEGKGLSTEDYTYAEKQKLATIERASEVNNVWFGVVQSVDLIEIGDEHQSCYLDFYIDLINRNPRNEGVLGDRFYDGDLFVIFFNSIDTSQYRPREPYCITRFCLDETPTQVTEKHPYRVYGNYSVDDLLFYIDSAATRTFVYRTPQNEDPELLICATRGSTDNTGEVRLTSSLNVNSDAYGATASAVKRLKDMIDAIAGGGFSYEIVQTLPAQGAISTTTMYLVPKQTAGTQNVYDEYINPTGRTADWEKIGDTEIDLSNYYTKTETDALLADKADTADLATVATTGSYNDLVDKPSIPSGQVQSDWNQTNTSEVDYIKNKPTIPAAQVNSDWNASSGVAQILNKPTIPDISTKMDKANPTGTGRLLIENDSTAPYLRTSETASGGQAQIETDTNGNSGMVCKDTNGVWHTGLKLNGSTGAWYGEVITEINGKQDKLVSGTNIKTINGRTILGSGDFSIPEPDNYSTVTSGEASAASGSWTSAHSFTFGSTGLWLVQISLTWSSNATGYREAGLHTSVAQPSAMNIMRIAPCNGQQTTANLTLLVNVTSASQTYHIVQRHNAGTALTVYPRMSVVRLSY